MDVVVVDDIGGGCAAVVSDDVAGDGDGDGLAGVSSRVV
jgi:hypothetical protein